MLYLFWFIYYCLLRIIKTQQRNWDFVVGNSTLPNINKESIWKNITKEWRVDSSPTLRIKPKISRGVPNYHKKPIGINVSCLHGHACMNYLLIPIGLVEKKKDFSCQSTFKNKSNILFLIYPRLDFAFPCYKLEYSIVIVMKDLD